MSGSELFGLRDESRAIGDGRAHGLLLVTGDDDLEIRRERVDCIEYVLDERSSSDLVQHLRFA